MALLYRFFFSWGLIWVFLLVACQSDSVEPESETERTILFYFAADCDLDSYIRKDINEILTGMVGVEGRVVIYLDATNRNPVLMTVKQEKERCVLDTLETYPEENSVSEAVLKRVTHRVRELFPAKSYGLVLGSHGSGWIPTHSYFSTAKTTWEEPQRPAITRYFGMDQNFGESEDRSVGMNLNELVNALPGGYEFIAFDVCLMGNIELLYALRHKAKYLLASPAEILLDGFPYDQVMPLLWGGDAQLKSVCQVFRDFYESGKSTVKKPWGMLSLVYTAYLDELAVATKAILSGKKEEVANMNSATVWRYPLIDYRNDVFFDFGNYIREWATEEQYMQFEQLLKKAIYAVSTTEFGGTEISAVPCSGVATYIPLNSWNSANEKYDELEWSQYVYGQ